MDSKTIFPKGTECYYEGQNEEKPLRLDTETYIQAIKAGWVLGKLTVISFFIISGMVLLGMVRIETYFFVIIFFIITRLMYLFGQPPGHDPRTIVRIKNYYKKHHAHH